MHAFRDSSGNPHISYWDYTNYDLKYAAWDGNGWKIETLDSNGYVGEFTSLALDSAGNPHISYLDYTNDDLKYATWDGNSWNIETVDSNGWVGDFTSLALDSSGNPHISYCDHTKWDLKYAYAVLVGDMDRNGKTDTDDINPFILAITDPNGYQAMYGLDPNLIGDCDSSGNMDTDDINPFVALITGGASAIPEPAGLTLLALGAVAITRRRRQ